MLIAQKQKLQNIL